MNVAKAGKVIEFDKFVHEGTGVEHGNTELSFYAFGGGVGGWDLDNEWVAPQVGGLTRDLGWSVLSPHFLGVS